MSWNDTNLDIRVLQAKLGEMIKKRTTNARSIYIALIAAIAGMWYFFERDMILFGLCSMWALLLWIIVVLVVNSRVTKNMKRIKGEFWEAKLHKVKNDYNNIHMGTSFDEVHRLLGDDYEIITEKATDSHVVKEYIWKIAEFSLKTGESVHSSTGTGVASGGAGLTLGLLGTVGTTVTTKVQEMSIKIVFEDDIVQEKESTGLTQDDINKALYNIKTQNL